MALCEGRIEASAVLAALAIVGVGKRAEGLACSPDLRRRACLDCLAEGLHDAADVVEGVAERITPPPSPEARG